MERYLEVKAARDGKVGEILRTQAGLTKKQISQMKFRPGGIRKNGTQCRVTENAVCGDVIRICLETGETDSAQLKAHKFLPIQAEETKKRSNASDAYADFGAEYKEKNESISNLGPDIKMECSERENAISNLKLGFPELEILYEDQDILAVNKPAGMVTHPSGIHYQDSLSNLIAEYFRSKGEETRIRSIGRLDKETSGILLFARNQISAARLQKQREEGKLQKTYLAVVEGTFEEEIWQTSLQEIPVIMEKDKWEKISLPLAPDPENPLKMVLSPEGTLPGSKNAVTYYQVLKSYGNASLVQLHLETGRTHQIRVHMAGTGHPLLGDTLYNESTDEKGKAAVPGNPFTRAALHAWKLEFYHPFTGEKILLEAPSPVDFESFLGKRKCPIECKTKKIQQNMLENKNLNLKSVLQRFASLWMKNALQGHLETQQQERKYEKYGKEKEMDGSSPVPGHAGNSGCSIDCKRSN